MNISDYAGILADLIAMLATVAAFWSAKSAGDATRLMREQQRGELVRQVNVTTNLALMAAKAVDTPTVSLSANAPSPSGPAGQRIRQQAKEYKDAGNVTREEVEATLNLDITALSDEELTRHSLRMDTLLVQPEGTRAAIRLTLDDLVADRRANNLTHAIAAPLRGIASKTI